MRTAAIALVLAVACVGVIAAAPTVAAGPGSGSHCNVTMDPWMDASTPVGEDVQVEKPGIECYY